MSSGYGDNSKHKATSDAYRNNKIWDKKPMASSTAEPMPQTIEAYKALAQRDLELIEEQQREIGRLKGELNERKQQLVSAQIRAQKLAGMFNPITNGE